MKKLLILAVLMVAIALPLAAQTDQTAGKVVFTGLTYTAPSGGFLGRYGVCLPVTGPIATLIYGDVGKYGSINTEFALITKIQGTEYKGLAGTGAWAGLIAGPNTQFQGSDPITYVAGAAGVIAGYWFTPKFGFWGGGKYNFVFESGTAYQAGWTSGGGITLVF